MGQASVEENPTKRHCVSATVEASTGVKPAPLLDTTNSVRRAAKKAPPIQSFLFKSNSADFPEQAASSSENVLPDCSGKTTVEAFMTVAGRTGKGGSITQRISVEEIERNMPVSFIPDLLPIEFADHLLQAFLGEAKRWHTSKRWLYDKEIESHRVESGFRFDSAGRVGNHRWESAGFGDDLRHIRSVVAGAVQRTRAALRIAWREARQGPASSAQAAKLPCEHELGQETVALASRGQRLTLESAEWLVRYACEYKQLGWRWEPNYCVANYYADENNFLGAHSDPVESLGPWAIVASLTLGAARQFRMKPVGTVRANGQNGRITSYSIRLPHNSLLIMWEGFQEFWRHEVPKDNGLTRHRISGPGRLNFTFRKSVSLVAKRRPLCQCGRKAHLKPVLKETSRHRGRYFWSCSNSRVRKGEYAHCDYFKWDDELIVDGTRISLTH